MRQKAKKTAICQLLGKKQSSLFLFENIIFQINHHIVVETLDCLADGIGEHVEEERLVPAVRKIGESGGGIHRISGVRFFLKKERNV